MRRYGSSPGSQYLVAGIDEERDLLGGAGKQEFWKGREEGRKACCSLGGQQVTTALANSADLNIDTQGQ